MLGMVTMLLDYGLYRIQDILPLKQNMANLGGTVDKNEIINGGGKVPGIIAFIQAASFVTNTDWQSYEPEQMFTHFSQIVTTSSISFSPPRWASPRRRSWSAALPGGKPPISATSGSI